MNGAARGPHFETLGERVFGLGQGDACPCCAAPLETDGRLEAEGVACARCGCEIEDVAADGLSGTADAARCFLCASA